jgi:hypothetical protein
MAYPHGIHTSGDHVMARLDAVTTVPRAGADGGEQQKRSSPIIDRGSARSVSLLNRKRVYRERIMGLRAWRFITLLLAALALTMESAHVLELPQKMQYDAQMYSAVNTTLYRYFAIVGGVYQVGSIVAAAVLTFLVHKRRPSFGWTLAGALCLLLAFGIWLAVVAPVNGEVAEALRSAPGSVPAIWMQLRHRWEYGHAAGFVVQLVGLCALVLSVLVETPQEPLRDRAA